MERSIQPNTAAVKGLTIVAPLIKGGSNSQNSLDAAAAIGAVHRSQLGLPGGVAKVESSGKMADSVMPLAAIKGPQLDGSSVVYINAPAIYEISNYDIATTYSMSVTAGSVSRSGKYVTLVPPAVPQTIQLTINERVIDIPVVPLDPVTPVILSPTPDAVDRPNAVLVVASDFSLPVGNGTHQSSDWELATDVNFTNVVQSTFSDTINKTTWLPTGLSASTDYYIRVRYRGVNEGYSLWSGVRKFTTKSSFTITAEEAELLCSDRSTAWLAGATLSIDATATRVVVGCAANALGFYVFVRNGATWTQEAKVIPPAVPTSVCIDDAGNRIVTGTKNMNPESVSNAGAAFIYVRSGSSWTQEAMVFAADRVSGDQLGESVGINADGTRVVAGTILKANGSFSQSGAVYVFTRSGNIWTQEAKVLPGDPQANSGFGLSIRMSKDSLRIVVGSYNGSYVFSRSGATWTQEAKLSGADTISSDSFGYSVAIDSAGTRIIVGARLADVSSVSNSGAAYIFTRSGTSWTQEAKISATAKGENDQFGHSVSMSDDGTKVAVGAYIADIPGFTDNGAAYIFTRSGTSWTQDAKLTQSDPSSGSDTYGASIALAGDGARLAVGAPQHDHGGVSNAGAVYIFA